VDERSYKGTCQGFGANAREVTLTRDQPSSNGLWLPVSDTDFRILARMRQILSAPSAWNHQGQRSCEDDQKAQSWSLVCALDQASRDVAGVNLGFRPIGMDMRARAGVLKRYNNAESTTFADIVRKLNETEERLHARQECFQTQDWKQFADGKFQWPKPQEPIVGRQGDVRIFAEVIDSVGVQTTSYDLVATADQLTQLGKPPDRWLADSTVVTTTAHTGKSGALDGVNVVGTLRNGNVWRSLSQCGVSLRYSDVPAEAASALDRLIESVYAQSR
jgi:hypothetical protein